ncbi:MAG: hypothetical protein U1C72_00330 [Candidatus Pacearchaeota archaeon]|nr:hypothetical protein [Candidatus Pacearchaeota archaeon]
MERAVSNFLNPPYLKDLSLQLAFCIVSHIASLHNEMSFENFLVTAVSEPEKEAKRRGFRASRLLAEELATALKLPLVKNSEVRGKNILLVDIVYADGASMEQEARALKEAGTQEVWGVVACRK